MLDNIFRDFTAEFALGTIAAGYVLTGIERAIMWVFNAPVRRQWAFWSILPFAQVVLIILVVGLFRPTQERPDFSRSSVMDYTIGEMDGDEEVPGRSSVTGITVRVALRNTGIASAIDSPNISVVTLAGKAVPGRFTNAATLVMKDGRKVRRQGTSIDPSSIVSKGGIGTLILVCRFENIRKEEAARAGSKLVLKFKDTFGRDYVVETVMDGTGRLL